MKEARIHDEIIDRIVNADDVLSGLVSKEHDFVDVEYNFRVTFVRGAKNHGGPYFRLYWSLEDYKKYSPEQKERYDILRGMSHFTESQWHRDWEAKVEEFAKIEKVIKNPKCKKYKRADAFVEKYGLCIEFQHSYIAFDFKERNEFYSNLGYKIVWLYDLTKHSTKTTEDGSIQILEDNARGFYRVAEEEKDLSNHPVFIQVKGGKIYKISMLYRKEIDGDKKSTIRYFYPDAIFDEVEFISALKNCDDSLFALGNKQDSIYNLWDNECTRMVFENIESGDQIIIYGQDGKMNEDFATGCITYQYVSFDNKTHLYTIKSQKFYNLGHENARKKVWKVLSKIKNIVTSSNK